MSNQLNESHPSAKLASRREKVSEPAQNDQGSRSLEEELKEKADDLNLINNLNQAFNRGASLPELLDLLAHETKRLYNSNGATIYVLSPDKKNLILYKHRTVLNGIKKLISHAPIDVPQQIVFPLHKDSVYHRLLHADQPQIIDDAHIIRQMIAECTANVVLKKMAGMFFKLLNFRSIIAAPLWVANQPIGILDISRNTPFSKYELTRFTHLAKHIALLMHHFQTEQYLKDSEARYRSFVTNFQGIAYRGNIDFTAVFFHGAVSEITGYTEDDFIQGMPRWDEIIYRTDLKQIEESIRRIATEPHYSCTREYRIIRKDGSTRWVREYARNICDKHGKPTCAEGSIYDITSEKTARDALLVSERKFRQFFEHQPTYCFMISPGGLIIDVNDTALKVLGYEKDELIGNHVTMVYAPECHEKVHHLLQQWKTSGMVDDSELIIISKSGSRRTILLSARAVKDASGRLIHSVSVQKDITEKKQTDVQIRTSLEEKKALLKEIHHRVKNNLQVISSLLNLQSSYIDNEKYQHFFKESQDRIKTMVLIHEKLYQSENLAAVSPSDYIKSIVRHLLDSYRVEPSEISLDSKIDDFPIDIDLAIPCGLIINELVSNALKHAFKEIHPKDKPRICISFSRQETLITLMVSDNGPGIPKIDLETHKTLGLQLVYSLAKQLNAQIEVNRKKGTSFTFTFQLKV